MKILIKLFGFYSFQMDIDRRLAHTTRVLSVWYALHMDNCNGTLVFLIKYINFLIHGGYISFNCEM